MQPAFTHTAARFSACGAYRYTLTREWDDWFNPLRRVLFVMLNPSTATEHVLDPTVRRCVSFAMRWGYCGLDVVNLFALRSTDPRALYTHADPIGPRNDDAIVERARAADLVIAAWGVHGALHGRGAHVLSMLRGTGCKLRALRLTSDGHPGHPLYVPGDARVVHV